MLPEKFTSWWASLPYITVTVICMIHLKMYPSIDFVSDNYEKYWARGIGASIVDQDQTAFKGAV